MVNFKLHLYFPGCVGGVIIKLKAKLNWHWTSQLKLSLAKIMLFIVAANIVPSLLILFPVNQMERQPLIPITLVWLV